MIITTELPPDPQPGELLSRYGTTPAVAVVVARPAMRHPLTPLMRDLVASTAPNGELTESPRNAWDATTFAIARLIGRSTQDILVVNAQHMTPELLDATADIAACARARLILAYDLNGYAALIDWAKPRQVPDLEWDDVHLPPPQPVVTATPDPFPTAVPDTDFPLFRSTARQTLDPDAFLQVDDAYCQAFRAAQAEPPKDPETAVRLLKSLVADTDSVARVVTLVRGMQAGALTRGFLVLADLNQVQVSVTEGRHRHLRPHDFERAWIFPDPQVGAIVALSDLGLNPETIQALTVADVSTFDVHPSGADLLRAHEAAMRLKGAQSTDRAFTGTRAVATALYDAGSHGIPTVGARKRGARADRWRDVFGLRVRALT